MKFILWVGAFLEEGAVNNKQCSYGINYKFLLLVCRYCCVISLTFMPA